MAEKKVIAIYIEEDDWEFANKFAGLRGWFLLAAAILAATSWFANSWQQTVIASLFVGCMGFSIISSICVDITKHGKVGDGQR